VTRQRADGSPVRTVFLGSGPFGLPALDLLAEHPSIELVGLVSAPARPAGRSRVLTPTVIADRGFALGIDPILTPERLRAPDALAAVLALEPGLAVLADYGQLVPIPLLGLPHGALNLHPSILPRHRGASPIPAAILAGDAITGVTLMQMDEDLDSGPIIAQERLALDGSETAPELERTLSDMAAITLGECLDPWLRGEIVPVSQDTDGASMTRPLRREDGRLDPERPAARLERQVRAYEPWPGSFIDTTAGRISIIAAADAAAEDPGVPGVLDSAGLATADGRRLAFRMVQPASGRPMTWDALLRGRPGLVGSMVRSDS
jgi:methionyl-tRNA formyltransferase